MKVSKQLFLAAAIMVATTNAVADHHSAGHVHGPNGGVLIPVGDAGYQVEILVQRGELLTIRVLDGDKSAVTTDTDHVVLTFTESDGESEDYEIRARTRADQGQVFVRKSSHVIDHVIHDKMSVKVEIDGEQQASSTFQYPHGPNGGELAPLGDSGLFAELLVEGDFVRVHVLDAGKEPSTLDASDVTLVFTEQDGETEEYEVEARVPSSEGTVFEVEDDHIADHVKRDKVTIVVQRDGQQLESQTFQYAR